MRVAARGGAADNEAAAAGGCGDALDASCAAGTGLGATGWGEAEGVGAAGGVAEAGARHAGEFAIRRLASLPRPPPEGALVVMVV